MRIRKNSGFTLLELLLASTISLIILSGITTLFETNSRVSDMQVAMVDAQESLVFLNQLIYDDIINAGLDGSEYTLDKTPFVWADTNTNANTDDEVRIRYNNVNQFVTSMNRRFSCGKNTLDPVIDNHYYIVDGEMFCNNVSLLKGIKRFKVLFGADLDKDGTPDRYIDAASAQVVSNDPHQKIVSVKIFILIESEKTAFGIDNAETFRVINEDVPIQDGKVYRYASRHINLRNMF